MSGISSGLLICHIVVCMIKGKIFELILFFMRILIFLKRYTSLGSIQMTSPNAALKKDNQFLPAYLLDDEEKERAGRFSNA